MTKKIFITGATDGIGLETAKRLAPQGHHLLIHGRNAEKLARTKSSLEALNGSGPIETYQADFSRLAHVNAMADEVLNDHSHIDVLINNAGVYKTSTPRTEDGFDLRFAVNLFAPVCLTLKLLPLMAETGRVVNLSSAAQSPISLDGLKGTAPLGDMPAYAQSKLALTMWTQSMAAAHPKGPLFVAVNPGSLLNTNMVKEGWGGSDNDVGIGADILERAALSPEFDGRSGQYFDNDSGTFARPHPEAQDAEKTQAVMDAIQHVLQQRP